MGPMDSNAMLANLQRQAQAQAASRQQQPQAQPDHLQQQQQGFYMPYQGMQMQMMPQFMMQQYPGGGNGQQLQIQGYPYAFAGQPMYAQPASGSSQSSPTAAGGAAAPSAPTGGMQFMGQLVPGPFPGSYMLPPPQQQGQQQPQQQQPQQQQPQQPGLDALKSQQQSLSLKHQEQQKSLQDLHQQQQKNLLASPSLKSKNGAATQQQKNDVSEGDRPPQSGASRTSNKSKSQITGANALCELASGAKDSRGISGNSTAAAAAASSSSSQQKPQLKTSGGIGAAQQPPQAPPAAHMQMPSGFAMYPQFHQHQQPLSLAPVPPFMLQRPVPSRESQGQPSDFSSVTAGSGATSSGSGNNKSAQHAHLHHHHHHPHHQGLQPVIPHGIGSGSASASSLQGATSGHSAFAPARRVSSKYRGVSWHRRDKSWTARIWRDGKSEHLGTFPTELRAALAVDFKAASYFGTGYADFNFPDEKERRQLLWAFAQHTADDESQEIHMLLSNPDAAVKLLAQNGRGDRHRSRAARAAAKHEELQREASDGGSQRTAGGGGLEASSKRNRSREDATSSSSDGSPGSEELQAAKEKKERDAAEAEALAKGGFVSRDVLKKQEEDWHRSAYGERKKPHSRALQQQQQQQHHGQQQPQPQEQQQRDISQPAAKRARTASHGAGAAPAQAAAVASPSSAPKAAAAASMATASAQAGDKMEEEAEAEDEKQSAGSGGGDGAGSGASAGSSGYVASNANEFDGSRSNSPASAELEAAK